jgi:hypothetical protein
MASGGGSLATRSQPDLRARAAFVTRAWSIFFWTTADNRLMMPSTETPPQSVRPQSKLYSRTHLSVRVFAPEHFGRKDTS